MNNRIVLLSNIFECAEYYKSKILQEKVPHERVLGCGTFSTVPSHQSVGSLLDCTPSFFTQTLYEKIASGGVSIVEAEPLFLKVRPPVGRVNIPLYHWMLFGLHRAIFNDSKIDPKKLMAQSQFTNVRSLGDWCHAFFAHVFFNIDRFSVTHVFLFFSLDSFAKYVFEFMNWLAVEKNNEFLVPADLKHVKESVCQELAYFLGTQNISQDVILVTQDQKDFCFLLEGVKSLKQKKLSIDRADFQVS